MDCIGLCNGADNVSVEMTLLEIVEAVEATVTMVVIVDSTSSVWVVEALNDGMLLVTVDVMFSLVVDGARNVVMEIWFLEVAFDFLIVVVDSRSNVFVKVAEGRLGGKIDKGLPVATGEMEEENSDVFIFTVDAAVDIGVVGVKLCLDAAVEPMLLEELAGTVTLTILSWFLILQLASRSSH